MSEEQSETGGTDRKVGIGCLGVIALFALLLLYGFIVDDGDDDEQARLYDVERVCKEAAEQRLKAPSTADFELEASGGPSTYTVTGTVDAENSFGAKLRERISCEISDSGDSWRLESFTGLN